MHKIEVTEGDFHRLSTSSADVIECFGSRWPTAVHAYEAQKFSDAFIRSCIRRARSPEAAEEFASRYQHRADSLSVKAKLMCMETILRAKLAQHRGVRESLLKSGTAHIVHNTPNDAFWGCGRDGNGHNHLGILWMKLRSELAECPEEQVPMIRYA